MKKEDTDKKNDKLFALINAMTKPEKRHFRLYCTRGNSQLEKNYLKLYEAIDEMKHFDKNKLLKKLKDQKIKVTHLTSDKNYLYELLLESLKIYHSNKTTRLKIIQYLSFIEILFEKGLIQQAEKQLKKAKKLALERSVLSYLNEILRWERKLKGEMRSTEEIDFYYKEYQLAINQIQEFNEYDFLYRHAEIARINMMLSQSPKNQAASSDIVQNPLISQKKPTSPFSLIRFEQINASYFFSTNNWKKEYQCNKKILSTMESIPKFKEEYPFEYISTFSRILILTKKIGPKEYQLALNRFLNFAKTSKRDQQKVKARVYSIAYSTEMVRIINEGLFEEGVTLIDKVLEVMSQFENYIEDSIKINNYYKFAYIHLALGNHIQALEFTNFLLNNFEERSRPDIFSAARLLLLLLHYELENYQILPYLTIASSRYFQKKRKLRRFEKHLFAFFKKTKNRISTSDHLSQEKILLEQLLEDFKDPKESYILNYFDFTTWLESKIAKQSFTQLKKKK